MSVRVEGGISRRVQHRADPPKLDTLPQDVLQKIFSMVSKNDLQAATLVNRSISESAIAAANLNERASIKKFIEILTLTLSTDTVQNQRNMLVRISQEITRENFLSLRLLKRYILDVKTQLINVIKTLDINTIYRLNVRIHPPNFLENIFALSECENQIDAAVLITDENRKERFLINIFKDLVKKAHSSNRAMEIARLISHEQGKDRALSEMASTFRERGDIDRAINVAELIPQESQRGYVLLNIAYDLTQACKFDKAITVATSISHEGYKGDSLYNIAKTLTKGGKIDRALQVARLIPNQKMKEYVFWKISEDLTLLGQIDRAIEVAQLIPNKATQGDALWYISEVLRQEGDIDKAIAVAKLISDEQMREEVLSSTSQALAQAGNIDKAIALAKLILNEGERERALEAISSLKHQQSMD